jgi:hypothetical protein
MDTAPAFVLPTFRSVPCLTDGCIEAWTTSFEIDERIFTLTFESHPATGVEYGQFCSEQCFDCDAIYLIKFDNAFNVLPEEQFKRMPREHMMRAHHMLRLAKLLAAGVEQFSRELNPLAIVGVPNDAKLARWYDRLAQRFRFHNHLIRMRSSAYHVHRVLVIHRV